MELDIRYIFSLFLALFMFYLGITARRPKLIISGGGGGGGAVSNNISHTNISIMNDPIFFGVRIDRQSAKIVHVTLTDIDTKEVYFLPGNWQLRGAYETSKEITINVGESEKLNIFVNDNNKYSICSDNAKEISDKFPHFTDVVKYYILQLTDSVGRKYRFDLKVINRKPNIQVINKITLRHRLKMLKEAFWLIVRAFKPGKFFR